LESSSTAALPPPLGSNEAGGAGEGTPMGNGEGSAAAISMVGQGPQAEKGAERRRGESGWAGSGLEQRRKKSSATAVTGEKRRRAVAEEEDE